MKYDDDSALKFDYNDATFSKMSFFNIFFNGSHNLNLLLNKYYIRGINLAIFVDAFFKR